MKKIIFFSLLISLLGSLGFISLIIWYSIVSFGEINLSSRLYGFSVASGFISFCLCIICLYFNFKAYKQLNHKIKYILLEILIIVVSFVPFLFMWDKVTFFLKNVF